MTIELTGNDLNVAQFSRVVFDREPAALAAAARAAMERSRAVVDKFAAEDAVVYGVTTGFGDLAQVKIPTDQLRTVQLNLLRSHASGVGEPLSETESRATVLLRANVLAKGSPPTTSAFVRPPSPTPPRRAPAASPAHGSVGAS